ncbi:hypothetical protein DASC09_030170 [Saccharomycopsis crataegensis]|uniref:Uncharacterized protein n=1 Tax=Saccharomycopsis crataegensis TaxID=43959 RepID=A0AAV5QMD0_9ASCO|nr:hypothetical protein DASC09_030170 [Saccharomycopsis crataegensis]
MHQGDPAYYEYQMKENYSGNFLEGSSDLKKLRAFLGLRYLMMSGSGVCNGEVFDCKSGVGAAARFNYYTNKLTFYRSSDNNFSRRSKIVTISL